jgi:hypothetical protein
MINTYLRDVFPTIVLIRRKEIKAEVLKMRKVFIEDLPKYAYGTNKNCINWKESIGAIVKFIYDSIEGEVEIVGYKNRCILIKYEEKDIFEINTSSFSRCLLGKLLDKYTGEFKIEVGTNIKDSNRDMTIIDRKYVKSIDKNNKNYNYKWYKYKCNKCGYEGWIVEGSILTAKSGCSCCSGKTVVLGINSIWDTDPWMIPFVGEEVAKTHTSQSNKRIYPICPNCGKQKKNSMTLGELHRSHSVGCNCMDGVSYSEKFIYKTLEQLNIEFIWQLSKNNFEWCESFRYDFYIPSLNCIVEVNGKQHYEETFKSWRSLEEEQKNDSLKYNLAKENGINKYIVIDCRRSEFDYIKNSIMSSELNSIFDLSKVNWIKNEEYAMNSLVKRACEFKRDNPNITTTEIAKKLNINISTAREYLVKGSNIWEWIDYNPRDEMEKTLSLGEVVCRKRVEVFKNGVSLGEFDSIHDLERQSESLFGVKLDNRHISDVCLGRRKTHKGFTFKHVEEIKEAG